MFGLGPMELAIIGVVAVLLFGSKLPKLAHSLGSSVVQFRRGVSGVEADLKSAQQELKNVAHAAERAVYRS